MLSAWWFWYDRPANAWAISRAGQLEPEHRVAHVSIEVDCDTVTHSGGRRVVEVYGELVFEGDRITITSASRARILRLLGLLETRIAKVEKVAHPPIIQDQIQERLRKLEQALLPKA